MARLSKEQVARVLRFLEEAEREVDSIKPEVGNARSLGIAIGKLTAARSIILDTLATEIELEAA